MAVLAGMLRYGPPLVGLGYLVTIAGDWLFFLFAIGFFAAAFRMLDGVLGSTTSQPTGPEPMRNGWDDPGSKARSGTLLTASPRMGPTVADERPVLTVLIDADCGVCRHTARTLQILDVGRRLRFTPLHDYLPAAPGDPARAELEAALHVRDERGAWHAGGDAALQIARVVPALAPLALAGRLPGMSRLAHAAYDVVARNRHAIGAWLGVERCVFDPGAARGAPTKGGLRGRPSGSVQEA